MKFLAEDARSNFAITPTSRMPRVRSTGVGGTGVIYVLHDATQPELYGGLPKTRTFRGPSSFGKAR